MILQPPKHDFIVANILITMKEKLELDNSKFVTIIGGLRAKVIQNYVANPTLVQLLVVEDSS